MTLLNASQSAIDVGPCEQGYTESLCSVCASGWAAGKSSCTKCEGMGMVAVLSLLFIVAAIAAVVVLRRRKKRLERETGAKSVPSQLAQYLQVALRIFPALVGDIKVFIGVYQTLTNMGSTLAITFPPAVETALTLAKEMVNLDLFSFGSVSCLVSSGYYGRLWGSIFVLLMVELAIFTQYRNALRDLGLDHVPDVHTEQAKKHLDEVHRKRRMAIDAKRNDWIHGLFSRFREGGHHYTNASEEAADAHQRAFELKPEIRAVYRKQERKAAIEQLAVGWAFFFLFLAFPSLTNKVRTQSAPPIVTIY